MAFVFSSLRSAARAVASTVSLVAAASLAGCAPETQPHVLNSPSPVEESAAPTATAPTETALSYSTDLQLSEQEKKAVDEALEVLQEFIQISNEVYSSGGEGAEKFDDVAMDSVLFAANDEANQMAAEEIVMLGTYRLSEIGVYETNITTDDDSPIPFINAHACVPEHEFMFTNNERDWGENAKESFATYEFVVAEYDGAWFVSEQYLWTDGCDL